MDGLSQGSEDIQLSSDKILELLSRIEEQRLGEFQRLESWRNTLNMIAELVFREVQAGVFNDTNDVELLQSLQHLKLVDQFCRGGILEGIVDNWPLRCPWCSGQIVTFTKRLDVIPGLKREVRTRECFDCHQTVPNNDLNLKLMRLAEMIRARKVRNSRFELDPIESKSDDDTDTSSPQYVTLDQMASLINRSKRTLERWITQGKLPHPDVEGGGGKPNEWKWSTVRDVLEKESGKPMRKRFPSIRK